MEPTIVDRLHAEFEALVELLMVASETSLVITADECFRKALLLTAASLFEADVIATIEQFVSDCSGGNPRLIEFVKRKALNRQYHTLFDWDASHARPFFALFGPEFKGAMDARTKGDEALAAGVAAFIELGRERNRLVHQNFGHFTLEKTADEIYQLYQVAAAFVAELPSLLRSPS